jgi:UDP-2-acetamido-2-deoxy-ribo-hexuluronate aminotransferase
MHFIDLQRQYAAYRPAIDAAIQRVLSHGQYILGPEVGQLEAELARFVGCAHAIGVSDGTSALVLALRALGIGPGDEVVTVPYTFIATAEAIALVGARPVFVDIEADGYAMDPERLEAAIGPRTRAILPVSLYGQPPELERIVAIADRHGLPVIEDAAQSFGATRHGRRSGGLTTLACTSFFPAKPLGCYGDGGAVFTSDARLAERIRALRVHGSSERHHHAEIGITGRLDTIQAAVLLAKLPHFADECTARAEAGIRYDRLLARACATPRVMPGNTHVYAQYAVRIAERDAVAAVLAGRGIPTAVHYPRCVHEQPAFASLGHRRGDFPVAERVAGEILCLPMHPFIQPAEQEQVAAAIAAAVRVVPAAMTASR